MASGILKYKAAAVTLWSVRANEGIIRAPWSESLSLNNEVNNYPCVCVFVPLQIIMRTLFRYIICTLCYDISFKCLIFQNPMVFLP